jgi:hypothetical protein
VTVSKTRRRIAAGLGLVATATVLAACDRPQPKVTVQSGSRSKIVSAQSLCVVAKQCAVDTSKIVHLTAAPGSQILVDVPKDLSDASWAVAAYTQDQSGKNTPLDVPGTGSPIKGKHAVRLAVPQATGGYLLQVSALAPTKQLTTWIIAVDLKL